MKDIFEPCVTEPKLIESRHTGDTQKNEALNQSISKYAPKNKFLGSTMDLTHRVHVAVGIHNLGHLTFWEKVYNQLEFGMGFVTRGYLSRKDNKKEKRRQQQRKPEVKKKRNRVKFEKLKQEMKKLKKDCERGATYGSGIGFDTITIPPDVKKMDREKKDEQEVKCKLAGCYKKDHVRRNNKACTYYKVPQVELESAINSKLKELYPSSYGKCISDFCLFCCFRIYIL